MQQLDVYYQLLSQHVSGIIMQYSHPTTQRPTTATNRIQQNQYRTPYAVTRSLFS